MKFLFFALLGIILFTSSVSAFQINWTTLEGNLSQGARDLAGDGTTSSGASGACNSDFFTGDDCGLIFYGILSLVLLNGLMFGLSSSGGVFILLNGLWIYILDQYQLIPHGLFVAVGFLLGILIAWGMWRMVQPR